MSPWSIEIRRLILLALLALLLGSLTGFHALMFLLAAAVYLTWHMSNMAQLTEWLNKNPDDAPPQSTGIWEEIFNALYRRDKSMRWKIKRAQRSLERFQESTTALPDATIILNKHDGIEWLNQKSQDYLGLQESDVGQRIDNLIRIPRFVDYLQTGNYIEPLELASPAQRGNILMIRIVPYGRSRRMLVARDMTRIQRLESMRRDFIANFSHELRTPMTVLRGYLENMQGDDNLAGEWGDALRTMNQQIRRMEYINDDLLFLSRLESPDNPRSDEVNNIPALLTAIREDAQALSQNQNRNQEQDEHQIELEYDEALHLRGSNTELRTAFSNLVFNAVRYTPPGGTIHIHWCADDNGAHLEVKDSGDGIAAHHIPRLTERFYRVDEGRSREKGGTGLGLAIVKHVLNRHQGRLEIRSQLGQGSSFICHFPASLIVKNPSLS